VQQIAVPVSQPFALSPSGEKGGPHWRGPV